MLILLPPSESKTRPAGTDPLRLEDLSFPRLTAQRRTMLGAAQRTARGGDGAGRLGVPASAPELLERMAGLDQEPAAPALSVYAGVLYDQLGEDSLPGQDREVIIQSALLGAVRAEDRIPAYRLSAGSSVQRLGTAASWWKPHLTRVAGALMEDVAAHPSPLVLDCRSGAYRSMMPLRSRPGAQVLEVAPVQERGRKRTVISHDAKRYRGWATRVLLEHPQPLSDAEAAASLLRSAFDGTLGVELDGDRLVIVDRVG